MEKSAGLLYTEQKINTAKSFEIIAMSSLAIIPAYNEEKLVGKVIRLTKKYVDSVLVVDDGSEDETKQVAEKAGAIVISQTNMGVGAALKSGYLATLKRKTETIIRINADMQHDPNEIPKFLEALENADYVIGSRCALAHKNMPMYRRYGNKFVSKCFSLCAGVNLTDVTCGYRAFRYNVLEKLDLDRLPNDFQIETMELLHVIQKGFRLKEIPIRCIYNVGEKSKMRPFRDGIRMAQPAINALIWRLSK